MKEELQRAIQLRKDKKPIEALAALEILSRSYPDDSQINYQIAWTYDSMGRERDAAPYYEKALAQGLTGDDRSHAMLGLGSTYRCLGEYRKSLEVFDRAVKEIPDDRALRVFRALTLFNVGKFEDSVSQMLVQLLETTNDSKIKKYGASLRYYSGRLTEKWD